MHIDAPRERALTGMELDDDGARALAVETDTANLMRLAWPLRDAGFGDLVTYSRKVFLPLTHLCRDVCHYCTFARTPRHIDKPYMSIEEVLEVARRGEQLGCHEALLTLGEKPELRYRAAREALAELGCDSTLEYVARVAEAILEHTALLPHINAGCMSREEIGMLRPLSASMGIMLESASERLCAKGGPHYGSPDKEPARRLATIERAGQMRVPFTSGILIGIGETRLERVESLLELRRLHRQFGHLQEIIVQNFKAKPATLMASAPEPDLNELLWTIAVARIVFGSEMSIQAPPNLSPGVLPRLIEAGINDWGGVSPLTPDFVNPEAPWPHVDDLSEQTRAAGKLLLPRLTIYPRYLVADGRSMDAGPGSPADAGDSASGLPYQRWLDPALQGPVLRLIETDGYPRTDRWRTGCSEQAPALELSWLDRRSLGESTHIAPVRDIVGRAMQGQRLSEDEICTLFASRGDAFTHVCQQADELRRQTCGDSVTYVVNRNINYTNICYFKCQFCAFSKGKLSENLRGRPYNLSLDEIVRRAAEAWERGATEVCLQGGIHPHYDGSHYLSICRAIKDALPEMHIHAFSPLEVRQGAATLGIETPEFLGQLRDAGLGTLPGTAAEILDDQVRAVLCADKLNTEEWLQVMASAHERGMRTTATIMFGHVDHYSHWARHLLRVRDLQANSGGFTEFVPLPFVGAEAPIYLKGRARNGPSFRECVLMHAVARLVLYPHITSIQASWVKMGLEGVRACLRAGVNDLGGTLMNESITRAAGASHGEELAPEAIEDLLRGVGREARQRNTLYGEADPAQRKKSYRAEALLAPVNTPQREFERLVVSSSAS